MNIWQTLFEALSIFCMMTFWAWTRIAPIVFAVITWQAVRKYSWSGLLTREYLTVSALIILLPAGICYVLWLWLQRRIEQFEMRGDGRLRIDIRRS